MQSLKIILPIGLGLFFITGIVTSNIRKEAEKNLNNEEKITAAVNRQILAQQEAMTNFENERRQAQKDDEFKNWLGLH